MFHGSADVGWVGPGACRWSDQSGGVNCIHQTVDIYCDRTRGAQVVGAQQMSAPASTREQKCFVRLKVSK
jgi:hypothetical protein